MKNVQERSTPNHLKELEEWCLKEIIAAMERRKSVDESDIKMTIHSEAVFSAFVMVLAKIAELRTKR